MNELIILLIILQAILVFIGLGIYATQVKNYRKELEKYFTLASVIPIILLLVGFIGNAISEKQIVDMFDLLIWSMVNDLIIGGLASAVLGKNKRKYKKRKKI